jgi:OPT family oligopeptide transporter
MTLHAHTPSAGATTAAATAPDADSDATAIRTGESSYLDKLDTRQVTLRAAAVGLLIGTVVCLSNFFFGLQSGWLSMMSLPAALLAFAIFKVMPAGLSKNFTDVENVFVQSVAVAVGTGPLCYGMIGIIPAMEKFMTAEESGFGRTLNLSLGQLMIWSLGLGLFGVFFAIPLRKQVIVKEKLPFPSGSATATLISVLHGSQLYHDKEEHLEKNEDAEGHQPDGADEDGLTHQSSKSQLIELRDDEQDYNANIKSLVVTFAVSSVYTVTAYFLPILKQLPVFGTYLSKNYLWNLQPSPAYVGQGIIMGLPTVSYMLFGAILGWGILAPLAQKMEWAPGKIDDWIHGGQGWILWISLSVMISDSLVSFVVVSTKSTYRLIQNVRQKRLYEQTLELQQQLHALLEHDASSRSSNEDQANSTYEGESTKNSGDALKYVAEVPSKFLISTKVTVIGVIVSSLLCIVSLKLVFGAVVPIYAALAAIILAMLFSILGVRALGETDLNPVSGIGKLSQLIFALIVPKDHPAKILINLVAGGVAEAGAQQAGDLMQDLKTGHLIGASPKAQFIAQILGTLYSVVLSSVLYKVYNSVYEIPSEMFRIPTAVIWIDCSRLVTGAGLPPRAQEFAIVFGVIFGVISLLKNTISPKSQYYKYLVYLPSGVAVGVGIYNTPNFTLARFIGGLINYNWNNFSDRGKIGMIIFSSGLVLGEGLFSGFTMLLTSLGVKHW